MVTSEVEEPATEEAQESERPALVEKDTNAPNRKVKALKPSQDSKVVNEEGAVDKENSTAKSHEGATEKASTPEKSASMPAPKLVHSPLIFSASTRSRSNARARVSRPLTINPKFSHKEISKRSVSI